MLVTESAASEMQSFHQPNNTASVAASCFYKHKLMGELKGPHKRSDFTNGARDAWQDKYYGPSPPSLTAHGNHFANINHAKQYHSMPARERNTSVGYSENPHHQPYQHQQSSPTIPNYYSHHTATSTNSSHVPTNPVFQWQHNLQQQQYQANQQLQHRLSQQQLTPHVSDSQPDIPTTASNRFTDMFLRSQHSAGYLLSINENPPPWCHPSAPSKDDLFRAPATAKNICLTCGKSYARPSTLKTHMRIHSGERPFHCKVCHKSFSQAANLTAHLRVHSGEKPFSCHVCHKTFSQSSSVTTHMRTHSGDRPYRCQVCRKGFSDSSTLTKHLRIHSGEKPYRCNFCSMSFSQSGNLNRHMKVHEHSHNPDSTLSPSSSSRASPS